MNKLLLLIITIFGLTLVSQKANAQWDLFSDLLNQTDNTVYNQFINNLGILDTTWNVNQVDGNELLNEHYDLLNNPLPGGVLDSTYLFGLDAGLDTLLDRLPGFGLAGSDADTLLGELDEIQDIFGSNFDSLGGLFGQYQDSLRFDSANWNVIIIDFDNLTDEHYDVLQDTLGMVLGTTSPSNPNNFANLIDKLFDPISFPDLELAFGVQNGDFKYWGEEYSTDAKVIRIGSVPRFDKEADQCNYPTPILPIEARWHVMASWNGGERTLSSASDATGAREEGDKGGFNPLMFYGDFAMMATPRIGAWGNTSFRLITSLGMEFGTYAPAHRDYRPPSVPRFDKEADQCNYPTPILPIEARWHVMASWNGGERTLSSASDATGAREEGDKGGFNPLMFYGDFAMMATPRIGAWGNTSFRLITSLGMEFGTYAPAHRDYRPPFTSFNKGFATGFGPQAGAGFAMTTGQLVIYSIATMAEGDVVRCALPYRYNSRRLEVGMRYGNIINVRCTTGKMSWQENDNRRANINHQVTVGIILSELNH